MIETTLKVNFWLFEKCFIIIHHFMSVNNSFHRRTFVTFLIFRKSAICYDRRLKAFHLKKCLKVEFSNSINNYIFLMRITRLSALMCTHIVPVKCYTQSAIYNKRRDIIQSCIFRTCMLYGFSSIHQI